MTTTPQSSQTREPHSEGEATVLILLWILQVSICLVTDSQATISNY